MTDIINTPDTIGTPALHSTTLPKGWERGKNDRDCIIFRWLEDFKYAEIRFEPQDNGYDYALYWVDVEGPGAYVADKRGVFPDMGKAIEAGNRL